MKLFRLQRKNIVERQFSENGINYNFKGDAAVSFPLNSNSSDVLSKLLSQGGLWSALDVLWADELVESIDQNAWRIPFSVYDQIELLEDDTFFDTLLIPKPEPLKIEAKSIANVGHPDFRIHIEATHPEQGPLRENDPKRFDRVFFLSQDCIVPLTREQANLYNTALGEGIDWINIEQRMSYLASTKDAAKKADASIDSYLENEDYEFRNEADLDLREISSEQLQIVPQIQGLDDYHINAEELLNGQVRGVVSKPLSPSKRNRMVLSKTLRENIEKLPKKGMITGVKVPKLLTQPETIIPEGFDLSLFSKRVKGIQTKVYNSRPYIHVGKNRGGWFEGIPGIEMEDWSPAPEGESEGRGGIYGTKPPNLSEDTYRELSRRAKESGEEYVLHEGNWIRIDPEISQRFNDTLNELEEQSGVYRIPAGSVLEIYQNLELLEFIDTQSFSKDDSNLPDDIPQIDPPDSFNGQLYPHQLYGYKWLHRLSNKFIGGLLADDMGLGKTIQVIAHMLKLREVGISGPHLVVIPKTLMANWLREIHQFSSGTLTAYSFDGPQRHIDASMLNQFNIVLVTYDTLRRDQARLATVDWHMVICDEAQYAKNPTTQRTCAVKALKSKHRAALTGTPVENGLIEFWCIMDFVQPGLLGSWRDFRNEFERPIIDSEGNERDNKIQELLTKIKGYYLRRLKDETIDLPDKSVQIIETKLSEDQARLYRMIAVNAKAGGRGAMLGAIQKLLMLCAHQSTFDQTFNINDAECPKLDTVINLLLSIKEMNEKAIIFTDFKIVQRVLQGRIRQAVGIWPDIINGEITSNRQKIIDIFSEKEGFNAIILGHQVAGVGLNITAANHVIHYTRPWNPAKENQATDRVHRIGQKKPVTVYYPIVRDARFKTVEDRLDELIRSKAQLARDVLRPTKEMQVKAEELFDCVEAAV